MLDPRGSPRKLDHVIGLVKRERSALAHLSRAEPEDLRSLAVRRLVSESFEVLAKGLNPSRFDSWSKGSRGRVGRQYGAASDLVLQTLRESCDVDRGDLASLLSDAGRSISDGASDGTTYHETAVAIGRSFYFNVARDDGFKIQMLAWAASRNRLDLSSELRSLYESLEGRIAQGIELVVEGACRELRPGPSIHDHAASLLALLEGSVVQGAVRGHEETGERFAQQVAFLLEHGTIERSSR